MQDKTNSYSITVNDSDIDMSGYNASYRTIFIVHGFTRSSRDDWIMEAKDAILSVVFQFMFRLINKKPLVKEI